MDASSYQSINEPLPCNDQRESRETYIENGLCFGFEGWQGCCERELDPGKMLCTRCEELAQAYSDEAEEILRREHRHQAGLFSDEEKEIIRESLNSNELAKFDQKCVIAEFLEGLKVSTRSVVDYLLAELREDPALQDHAARVTAWHCGRFITVCELMDECEAHHASSLIYEAWAWETAQRARDLIRKLHGTPARALTVYAKHRGVFEVSYGEMMNARREARIALYGHP